jgi:hypothetical protein
VRRIQAFLSQHRALLARTQPGCRPCTRHGIAGEQLSQALPCRQRRSWNSISCGSELLAPFSNIGKARCLTSRWHRGRRPKRVTRSVRASRPFSSALPRSHSTGGNRTAINASARMSREQATSADRRKVETEALSPIALRLVRPVRRPRRPADGRAACRRQTPPRRRDMEG